MSNNSTHATTNWVRYDQYESIMKISRWVALVALFKGKVKLQWYVPATKKNKTLTIKGKKSL